MIVVIKVINLIINSNIDAHTHGLCRPILKIQRNVRQAKKEKELSNCLDKTCQTTSIAVPYFLVINVCKRCDHCKCDAFSCVCDCSAYQSYGN